MPKKKTKKREKKCGHGGKREGAGRPSTGGRTTTGRCYTASKEENKALLRRAAKDDISIGLVMKAAVRQYLGLD